MQEKIALLQYLIQLVFSANSVSVFMQGSPALFSVMIKRRCSVYLRGLLCLLNLLLNEVIGSDGLVMVHVLQSLQLVMWLNVISFDVPSGRDNRSVASQVAVCSFL